MSTGYGFDDHLTFLDAAVDLATERAPTTEEHTTRAAYYVLRTTYCVLRAAYLLSCRALLRDRCSL